MNSDRLDDDLLALLGRRAGHFRLESGNHSDIWLDLDSLFQRPAHLRRFTEALAQRFADGAVEAVCGPLTGGAFVAQMVAVELGVEFYYTERVALPDSDRLYAVHYRLPDALRHGVGGKKVAIVDDAISAGSAVRATYHELRASGAIPISVGALLVQGRLAAQLVGAWNVALEWIAHLPNEPWPPDACPLCASGAPLEKGARP